MYAVNRQYIITYLNYVCRYPVYHCTVAIEKDMIWRGIFFRKFSWKLCRKIKMLILFSWNFLYFFCFDFWLSLSSLWPGAQQSERLSDISAGDSVAQAGLPAQFKVQNSNVNNEKLHFTKEKQMDKSCQIKYLNWFNQFCTVQTELEIIRKNSKQIDCRFVETRKLSLCK